MSTQQNIPQRVRAILAEQAGRQLDNLVVDALERIINNYAGGS